MERITHTIDADGQSLGRVASQIALLLQGKNKVTFTPNKDEGDFVNVVNASKIKITGNKINQKKYKHFSGYPGGLKETTLKKMLHTNPNHILLHAVRLMLPKNKLQTKMIRRLDIKQ